MPGVVVLTGLDGLVAFVQKAEPEPVGNTLLCLIHQTTWLTWRQMRGQMK
jgi:hypothetical protein